MVAEAQRSRAPLFKKTRDVGFRLFRNRRCRHCRDYSSLFGVPGDEPRMAPRVGECGSGTNHRLPVRSGLATPMSIMVGNWKMQPRAVFPFFKNAEANRDHAQGGTRS